MRRCVRAAQRLHGAQHAERSAARSYLATREDVRVYVPPQFAHLGLLWWRSQSEIPSKPCTGFILQPPAHVVDGVTCSMSGRDAWQSGARMSARRRQSWEYALPRGIACSSKFERTNPFEYTNRLHSRGSPRSFSAPRHTCARTSTRPRRGSTGRSMARAYALRMLRTT